MSASDNSSFRKRHDVGHTVLPGGLSAGDRERIHELAEQGWRSPRIAREIQKHPSTVQWFMYREGLKPPRQASQAREYLRGGRVIRSFSDEEDAFICALRVQGFGFRQIADLATKRFGHPRNHHTIACRIVMLAGLEEAA